MMCSGIVTGEMTSTPFTNSIGALRFALAV